MTAPVWSNTTSAGMPRTLNLVPSDVFLSLGCVYAEGGGGAGKSASGGREIGGQTSGTSPTRGLKNSIGTAHNVVGSPKEEGDVAIYETGTLSTQVRGAGTFKTAIYRATRGVLKNAKRPCLPLQMLQYHCRGGETSALSSGEAVYRGRVRTPVSTDSSVSIANVLACCRVYKPNCVYYRIKFGVRYIICAVCARALCRTFTAVNNVVAGKKVEHAHGPYFRFQSRGGNRMTLSLIQLLVISSDSDRPSGVVELHSRNKSPLLKAPEPASKRGSPMFDLDTTVTVSSRRCTNSPTTSVP